MKKQFDRLCKCVKHNFQDKLKHDTCTCNLPTGPVVVEKDIMCTYPTVPPTILFHAFVATCLWK